VVVDAGLALELDLAPKSIAIIALLALATAAVEAKAVEDAFIKVSAVAVKESVAATLASPIGSLDPMLWATSVVQEDLESTDASIAALIPIPIASMALAPATAPFVDDGADDMPTVGVVTILGSFRDTPLAMGTALWLNSLVALAGMLEVDCDRFWDDFVCFRRDDFALRVVGMIISTWWHCQLWNCL